MYQYIISSEVYIRIFFFLSILFFIMLWEGFFPRRPLSYSRLTRWPSNLGIIVVNVMLLRFLFPVLAVETALLAQTHQWGLLQTFSVDYAIAVILSVIALDCVIYLQHVMFHAVPLLWRLHRMHHTDLDFDVTTGLRFHPIEIMLSMLIKMAAIVILGAPALSVLIFEILLNATSMFNHGNIKIPIALDRYLRLLVVTPDMHRVHHSIIVRETNSNFGFNLPWWDRLLGTYKAQPEKGHQGITIGINLFREPKFLQLHWLLIQPFIRKTGDYAINKR